ncbi:MAG: response regulator [Spirochaetales bacterium]|nr:response regulator [Spirochaetales bacterium]
MNDIFKPVSFQWFPQKHNDSSLEMEVCTRKKKYGYFACSADADPDPIKINLIHNAVQILATLLEKIDQETNLQQLVDTRTAELSLANRNLENTNRDLQEQIDAHTKTLETLRKSEDKYKSLIDKIQTAIILHDKEGIITDTNPMAVTLMGGGENSLKGRSLEHIRSFVRDDGSSMPYSEYPISRVLVQKEAVRNQVVGIRHMGQNDILWTLVNAEPEFDDQGAVFQVIVTLIDITRLRKMDALLKQSQKMDAIGQLAGGVAHDFNNMLSGIIGASQLLQTPERQLDPIGHKYVEMILEASHQAAELTRKLLTFGRKTEIRSLPLSIHIVIKDVVALLQRTIDKRVTISVTEEAEQTTVLGDNAELQNSLLNLGINASHAMPEGGKLQISTRNIYLNAKYCQTVPFDITPGNYIEIEIRDSGTGIPPENISRIFDPFFTTKEQGKGTGLGLSTVYATVQNHHGAINIYSELGVGTVFHIYLPCSDVTPAASTRTEEPDFSGHGLILLVDDEELVRTTARDTLSEMGFSVMVAQNGLEAVKLFGKRHSEIDLVIMDMLMPGMNGSDAFFAMKETDPDCKVIISSGFTKDENLKEMKDAGLSGYIQKPFKRNELQRLLSRILTD